MSSSRSSEVFSLAAGKSVSLVAVFNSSDFNKGGDYMGPMVVAGVPWDIHFHQILAPSTVSLEFTEIENDFQSFCIYHFSIRNDSANSCSFVIDYFYD